MKKIAIFASGSGSNAQNIIEHFRGNSSIEVSLVLSNKKNAFVLDRAKNLGVKALVFDRPSFYESDSVLDILKSEQINFIVLAGFLWLVPDNLVKNFPDRIVNIHPALLPKYGGKGMYGSKVHEMVVACGEKETGITIHYVNQHYDEGNIIFQARCTVHENDTPDDVANNVHQLEYKYFPKQIEKLVNALP